MQTTKMYEALNQILQNSEDMNSLIQLYSNITVVHGHFGVYKNESCLKKRGPDYPGQAFHQLRDILCCKWHLLIFRELVTLSL